MDDNWRFCKQSTCRVYSHSMKCIRKAKLQRLIWLLKRPCIFSAVRDCIRTIIFKRREKNHNGQVGRRQDDALLATEATCALIYKQACYNEQSNYNQYFLIRPFRLFKMQGIIFYFRCSKQV